jgi:hypothetical protein
MAAAQVFDHHCILGDRVHLGNAQTVRCFQQSQPVRFHGEESGGRRATTLDHHAPAILQRQPMQTVGQGIDT